jgi:hypothetical protein
MDEVFSYLMTHWLRFVEDNGTANRSRWPVHPTWATLRDAFGDLTKAQALPLDGDQRALVRGARYSGKMRILVRLQEGILGSLEVEDASPVNAALQALLRWVDRIAEKEIAKITAKCERYARQGKSVPAWVQRGMDERYGRVEQIAHRVSMLLGAFGAYGVLPLEPRPVASVADLVVQSLDALEQEAERRGGIRQVFDDHFAKVYKVSTTLACLQGRRAA